MLEQCKKYFVTVSDQSSIGQIKFATARPGDRPRRQIPASPAPLTWSPTYKPRDVQL